MKHVFKNQSACAHAWAHQTSDYGRAGPLSFDGATIYSYGTHFPIARWIENERGERAVLLTNRSYSITTAQHISGVRAAIPVDATVFQVALTSEFSDASKTLREREVRVLLELIRNEADRAVEWSAAPRIHQSTRDRRLYHAAQRNETGSKLAKFLGGTYDPADISTDIVEIRARIAHREAVAAALAAERAAKRTAERAAEIAEIERRTANQVEDWKHGRTNRLPPYTRFAFLRVNDETGRVETSRSADVSIPEAVRTLAFIESIWAAGETWPRCEKFRFDVGPFELTSVDAEVVWIGCHVFQRAEIERFAPLLRAAAA